MTHFEDPPSVCLQVPPKEQVNKTNNILFHLVIISLSLKDLLLSHSISTITYDMFQRLIFSYLFIKYLNKNESLLKYYFLNSTSDKDPGCWKIFN